MIASSSPFDVDVIIPVFNGANFLEAAVLSAIRQSRAPRHVILADDGSTDATPEIASRFVTMHKNVVYLPLPHKGVSAARNAGIAASDAPFVAFLDADDVWRPDKLEKQLEVFQSASREVGFVHSSYAYIDELGSPIPNRKVVPPQRRGDIFHALLFENYVLSGSASSVVVRREVLDHAGYFDETLFHGEDWDLWIRLAAISAVDYCSEALVFLRVNPASAQRRNAIQKARSFFMQRLIVYEKWPDAIAAEGNVRNELRKHAVNIMLPALQSPGQLVRFQRELREAGPLGRDLFAGPSDFANQMALGTARYIVWKLKQRLGWSDV